MLSHGDPRLVAAVLVLSLTALNPVESLSLGRGSETSTASSQCDCLPDRFQGRMRVSDLRSSNADGLATLAMLSRLYDHTTTGDDLEILFKIDLLKGLMIFESSATRSEGPDRRSSHGSDKLRQWAIVIDVGHLLETPLSLSSSELAAVYFVDKESNNVWRVDIGENGRRTSGRNRRHLLNRCPLKKLGWERHEIDGIGPLYLFEDQESNLPMLMALSARSCLPNLLSDVARVAVIFDMKDELHGILDEMHALESSLLMYEAMILRAYLHDRNQDYLDVGDSRSGMLNDKTTAVVALIIRWLLNTEDGKHVTPKACCTPQKWQGSVTKTVTYQYKVMDQAKGAQTMVMDKVYVDHGQHAVAGSFYQIVYDETGDNFTFLAFFDADFSQSAVIYLVDVPTNSCMALNITGVQLPNGMNCLSQDVATYIGQINFGMQLSLEGWRRNISIPAYEFTSTTKQYVALVHDREDKVPLQMHHGKPWPTCMTVVEITDWESTLESVSTMAMIYNADLGVPDDAFTMPPSCVGVEPMTMSNDQAAGTFQPVMSLFGSL